MNNSTCPEGQLEPAFWDRPDQYYYFHDLNVALSSTVPAPTAFSTAVSTSAPASNTPTPSASASPDGVSGRVIGGAVGGSLAGLIIIATVVFFLFRRRRNKKANAEAEAANGQVIPKAELASPTTTTGFAPSNGFSPPPTYSWDTSGHGQKWTQHHIGTGEMMGDTRNREVNAKCADSHGPAELYGALPAGELESPEYIPKVAQGKSAHDTSKQHEDVSGAIGEEKAAAVNAQT
ncbi:hypothetical protein J4E93_000881 [Alternaria ventricosa]|uniref:uncharacterized protein n=1 Tax=Alternaria ventricosa TaxID=1187951 RepID=UPI0020C27693|nr:uncharacterized protein J4E93_000881 [Alternaria ventricosa]KAI4656162.1 hypothetical protein J4E93_000881 [Alternaria ventricosa]